MISLKELEVKQIGAIHNVSGIGTKPLSQQRLKFLLRKRHASDGDGNRAGEKERDEVEDVKIQPSVQLHVYSIVLFMYK